MQPVGASFELLARDDQARRGLLHTAHGAVNTPAFMPVGTAATVKAMLPGSVAATGTEIVLANTYHLMLRPGAERVAALGGLHRFMNWDRPLLTDSGGFQVMSLAGLRTLGEDGVVFKSHLDGSLHALGPERSVEIQELLDTDIAMCFDECTPFPATREQAETSMLLSMRWAERSRARFRPRPGRGLFGIVQGGVYLDLRARSVMALTKIGFEGYAIGGLAVGEGQAAMFQVVEQTAPLLPAEQPRYLMGVGKPDDLVGAVMRGIDLFDCVLPTRSGRTGQAFTRRGTLNMRNARHGGDDRPIDDGCDCPACRGYSRAYIHHLIRAQEILGVMLLTWHNLHYYQALMAGLRAAIEGGRMAEFAAGFEAEQGLGDIPSLADRSTG
ncbi:MAG: tRNA guanosine(34) transglycosylase Tgt [Proteobacteria bacterium]|nr:tRNA guanosine(34) transglycosylase Tgt [Pseudomonadota bacterium]